MSSFPVMSQVSESAFIMVARNYMIIKYLPVFLGEDSLRRRLSFHGCIGCSDLLRLRRNVHCSGWILHDSISFEYLKRERVPWHSKVIGDNGRNVEYFAWLIIVFSRCIRLGMQSARLGSCLIEISASLCGIGNLWDGSVIVLVDAILIRNYLRTHSDSLYQPFKR